MVIYTYHFNVLLIKLKYNFLYVTFKVQNMPINKSLMLTYDIVNTQLIGRSDKLEIADTLLQQAIVFINQVFENEELSLPQISHQYDPGHASRWMHFFLRESVRNSVDACFSHSPDKLDSIQIKVTIKTKPNGHLHLKLKDNGIGFMGAEISVPFTKIPKASEKDKSSSLGGKGFGLGICGTKLPLLTFKNRKVGGASVQFSLGEESNLKMTQH